MSNPVAKDGHTHDTDTVRETASAAGENRSNQVAEAVGEIGGPKGLEPTRYGDWEKAGRCIDF